MKNRNDTKCEIRGKTFPEGQLMAGHGIRHEIERLIVNDHSTWNDKNLICRDDFNLYRLKYISGITGRKTKTGCDRRMIIRST